jgi:hypothetical protein
MLTDLGKMIDSTKKRSHVLLQNAKETAKSVGMSKNE